MRLSGPINGVFREKEKSEGSYVRSFIYLFIYLLDEDSSQQWGLGSTNAKKGNEKKKKEEREQGTEGETSYPNPSN